ncbi:MAG: hypothetical protein GY702_25715 [Desulfobulbaceae bacterium]|nr:hypothetical protein [Desulfobulbaceae bacterium]
MTVDFKGHQAPAHAYIGSVYTMINGRAGCGLKHLPEGVRDPSEESDASTSHA